jgi:sugar-specific transcriptional regulator TrmB
MNKEEILIEIGLNKNEAGAYLALLKMGSSKVNDIYEETKIQRTFIYEILRNLIEKGLVNYVVKSGVKYFEASNPDKLKEILKEKQDMLDKVLPELKSIKSFVKEKPAVELYEGKAGLKTILEDILKLEKGETMYAYANNDLFEKLRFYFPNFVRRRVKSGIKAKIIQERIFHLLEGKKKNEKELRGLRFSEKPFKSSVFIWKNKIALLTLRGDSIIGVVIENNIIAETQRQVFDLLWNITKTKSL